MPLDFIVGSNLTSFGSHVLPVEDKNGISRPYNAVGATTWAATSLALLGMSLSCGTTFLMVFLEAPCYY